MKIETKSTMNLNIDGLIAEVEKGVQKAMNIVRDRAVELEKGHNRNGITTQITEKNSNNVVGKVTAKAEKFPTTDGGSYLWYEYYGTGEYAEKPHVGTTKHFVNSGYTEWLIPVDIVSKPLNFIQIELNGTLYYLAHGQKANHFMSNAEFQTRNIYRNEIEKTIRNYMRGARA